MVCAITEGAAPPWESRAGGGNKGPANPQQVCLWCGEVVADVTMFACMRLQQQQQPACGFLRSWHSCPGLQPQPRTHTAFKCTS